MSHEDHNGHEHEHEHNEIAEAIELADSKRGRRKLLFGAVGNFVMMVAAAVIARKSGADPTAIEMVHNFGDTGYYLAPWLVTMRHHIHHEKATRWMRKISKLTIGLTAVSVTSSVYEAVADGVQKPEFFSGPAQAGFILGNGLVAAVVGHRPGGSVIDEATRKHAITDMNTSIVATAANFAAQVVPVMNPIGAAVAGGMTIRTELHNVDSADQELGDNATA